jgi:hypothetical protein
VTWLGDPLWPRTCQCVGDICGCGRPTTYGTPTVQWSTPSPEPQRLHPDDLAEIARQVAEADPWKQRVPLCRNPDCPYLSHVPASPCPASPPKGHERE